MISRYLEGPRVFGVGDDGSTYYITQVDGTSTLWWLAESQDGSWATVFRGLLTRDGAIDRWDGQFIDVVKGTACAYGRLVWETRGPSPRPSLVNTDIEGRRAVYPTRQIQITAAPVATRLPQRVAPGFAGNGLENLTGVWLGIQDRGDYYVREVAEDHRVAWLGEHPEAVPDTPMGGRRWVNVFMGQRRGRFVSGEWADVPKGEVAQSGEMELFASTAETAFAIRRTGGFGNRAFRRRQDMELTLTWQTLEVLDKHDWSLAGDDPYFMALVAVMDGATVSRLRPERSRARFDESFVAPVLRTGVQQGEPAISLATVPPLVLSIRPVPGDAPANAQPVLAVVLRGGERDTSGEAWREDRLQDWIDTGGGQVDRVLQRGEALSFPSVAARWHTMFTWNDEDDLFGIDSIAFTYAQLTALSGSVTPVMFDLVQRDPATSFGVHYRITASLDVRGVRGTCAP